MPEGLTQTKTPTSKNPAGFKSECRPVSFRNRGRLQIGTMAGFKSEYPAGINRNPQRVPVWPPPPCPSPARGEGTERASLLPNSFRLQLTTR